MKELILGVNTLPEMKVIAIVVIDSGGGANDLILTDGVGINSEWKHPKKFLIDDTLLLTGNLTLRLELLATGSCTNSGEVCAPMMMELTSNEVGETLVFAVHKITGEKIGELYVSYLLTEKSLAVLSSPHGDGYSLLPGKHSGHGGGSGSMSAYRPVIQAHLNYGHLPGHHHVSVPYSHHQDPSAASISESESRPLIDPYHGYGLGSNPSYMNLPQYPPQHQVYPPMQPQVSKIKKFRAALRSVAARFGALLCGNVIAEAAAAAAAAAAGDDGGEEY